MDANQLLDIYSKIESGELLLDETGDITFDRILYLINLVINEKLNSDRTDTWSANEAELLTLVVESRDTSQSILYIFDALSVILKRKPAAVQYKYYTLQKRIDEGMTREQAWNSKRGKRGRGKKNIKKLSASDLLVVFPNNSKKELSFENEDDLELIKRFASRFTHSDSKTKEEIMKMLNKDIE